MMHLLGVVARWLDARLGLSGALLPILRHPIPRGAAGPMGWWYVFGSASVTLLLIQILTGIGLALVYVPAADKAYDSLLYLNYNVTLGWFLRALHYYAGSGMMVMVLAHMTQVFLHGAYKYPRELTWVLGVFLLLCTLGMFFTGQILRWDPDAYWGLGIAGSIAGRVPVIGPWAVRQLLGGPVIGGDSLSRFFALHVFVIPGALLTFLAIHLWLVLKCGISAPPEPDKPVVDAPQADAEYEKELEKGVPFLGDAVLKDAFCSALAVIVVVALAAILGPRGPSGPPDPTVPGADPRPEWPFLWLFALLALSPSSTESFLMLGLPAVLIVALLLVPFVNRWGERAPSRRPVSVILAIVLWTVFGVLTYQGVVAPWSPHMTAWSGESVPEAEVRTASPLRLQGAAFFQNKNCRNCHALEGRGGERGPDLTFVGTRLTHDQLVDQISNGSPGGGNMPAYGKEINAVEMEVLVAFLEDLRPAGEPPARPPAPQERKEEQPRPQGQLPSRPSTPRGQKEEK